MLIPTGLTLPGLLGRFMGSSALVGGAFLLSGESAGLGIDFTSANGLGSVAVKGHTTNLNNVSVDSFLTNSGTSTKWVKNAAGVYVEKAAGTVAMEYDAGWYALTEPAATNLLLQSSQFDNASWVKRSVTVGADNAVAPDGTTTADTLTPSGGAGRQIDQAVTTSSGSAYTFSVFLKAGTGSWAKVVLSDFTDDEVGTWVNLSNGTLGTSYTLGTWTVTARTITSVGNGWYRVTVTTTVNVTSTTGIVKLVNADSSETATADQTIIAWGTQLELGTVATSPIPTTTSTVTRAADAVKVATSAFPAFQATGSVIAEISQHVIAYGQFIVGETGGSTEIYSVGSSYNSYDGTSDQQISTAVPVVNTRYKIVNAFGGASRIGSVNGSAVATSAYTGPFTGTPLGIGCRASANDNQMHGRFYKLIILPRKLSAIEVVAKATL